MAKVRVPVAGTIGKSILLNSDATYGAQLGNNLFDENGNVLTLDALVARVTSLNSEVNETIFESQIVDLQAYLLPADIGVTVQAYSANLDTWASIAPSSNVQSMVSAANYAAIRALLDLEVGTDFYSIAAADAAFAPISHTHTAADIDSETATDGYVLTANGAGGSVWEAVPGGGGITAVVEDVTPQLGGDLVSNSFNIVLDDTDEVIFGAGNDVSMSFDGADFNASFIGSPDWNISGLARANFVSKMYIESRDKHALALADASAIAVLSMPFSGSSDVNQGVWSVSSTAGDQTGFIAAVQDGARNNRTFFGLHDNDAWGLSRLFSAGQMAFKVQDGGKDLITGDRDAALSLFHAGNLAYQTRSVGGNVRSPTGTDARLYLQGSDGTDYAWFRSTNANTEIRHLHPAGGSVQLIAVDFGGTTRILANFDPDGSNVLYFNGTSQLFTKDHTATGSTSGAQLKDGGGTLRDIGYNDLAVFNDNVSDTLEAQHAGTLQVKSTSTARTLTLAASSDLDFPVGYATNVINYGTANDYTITEGTGTTLYYNEPGSGLVDCAGSATVGPGGTVTIWRRSASAYVMWGSEITP